MLNRPRSKQEGTYRSGERGGGRLLCDPGSELVLGGSGRSRARIVKGMENKEKCTINTTYSPSIKGSIGRHYCTTIAA